MNVFEFLGLNKKHRPDGKVVQLVKHMREVPVSKQSFPRIAQVKKDGVFAMLVVREDGERAIFGRTGKMLMETKLIAYKYPALPKGVYIAELCCDTCSLEVLSGIVNPNRKAELSTEQFKHQVGFYLAFHDCIGLDEFIAGRSNNPYTTRVRQLELAVGTGNTLPCYVVHNEEEAEQFAEKYIERGEEGAVFKDDNCGWTAGHKGWHVMKIVRGVSYDLECIGCEEGTGKYAGKVANLLFRWKDGKTIKAMLGKGWTHQDAEDMFNAGAYSGKYPIGKIFEVKALQESSKGVLRLPKVSELRHDKVQADF